MGKDSRIEWTDHTFNPWWGCVKVSAACKHCYAEAWAKRTGQPVWGIAAPRRFFGPAHWNEPRRWNDEAERAGQRRRVFCASMADVFEDRRDLDVWRKELGKLIVATQGLDWLLLTKRPERVADLAPWREWPRNVWLGTTVETQECADVRLPVLAAIPARLRFLSCEPLLGPLHLGSFLHSSIHWVIAGGESGGKARPSDPSWFRALRDQCEAAGVPFHFKQWGNWVPSAFGGRDLVRVSKKSAGRLLDGRTWDQLPP